MADFANNPELRKWANQLFTPKRTDGGFAARSLVCLGGLKSAQELNGRMAMVIREMDSGGRMTEVMTNPRATTKPSSRSRPSSPASANTAPTSGTCAPPIEKS